MVAMTAEAYRAQLQALLPPGELVWPRDPKSELARLLAAKADGLAQVDARAKQLLDESVPDSALEMLPDWERVVGLPDACSTELANTIAERRMNVVAKLTMRGGASKAWFIAYAAKLGYAIEIDEFHPFIAGLSRCGDRLNGDHIVRHTWRVRVLGPRFTPFRTGASQCGDRLGKITRAEDLECRFRRANQAHKNLIVAYEGA